MKSYEAAGEKRISDERKKLGGLRRAEADKKFRSIPFLVIGDEGEKGFSQKNRRVETLSISLNNFEIFWTLHLINFQTSKRHI